MAKVSFSSLVTDVRNRVGNVVFSKWRQTHYVREYVPYAGEPTPNQLAVRTAFTLLVSVWKNMNGIMHASWDNFSKNQNMTGYNAFLGKNSNKIRNGEPLELFREFGLAPLASLSASAGASGSVVCQFTMPEDSAGRRVTFFSQKIINGNETAEIKKHEAGPDPLSPYTISGLEPGASYFIYAVMTDSAYADASAVSAAVSASAAAGA